MTRILIAILALTLFAATSACNERRHFPAKNPTAPVIGCDEPDCYEKCKEDCGDDKDCRKACKKQCECEGDNDDD